MDLGIHFYGPLRVIELEGFKLQNCIFLLLKPIEIIQVT